MIDRYEMHFAENRKIWKKRPLSLLKDVFSKSLYLKVLAEQQKQRL